MKAVSSLLAGGPLCSRGIRLVTAGIEWSVISGLCVPGVPAQVRGHEPLCIRVCSRLSCYQGGV